MGYKCTISWFDSALTLLLHLFVQATSQNDVSCRNLMLGRDIGLGDVGVHRHCVTFNLGSAEVCRPPIFETFLSWVDCFSWDVGAQLNGVTLI